MRYLIQSSITNNCFACCEPTVNAYQHRSDMLWLCDDYCMVSLAASWGIPIEACRFQTNVSHGCNNAHITDYGTHCAHQWFDASLWHDEDSDIPSCATTVESHVPLYDDVLDSHVFLAMAAQSDNTESPTIADNLYTDWEAYQTEPIPSLICDCCANDLTPSSWREVALEDMTVNICGDSCLLRLCDIWDCDYPFLSLDESQSLPPSSFQAALDYWASLESLHSPRATALTLPSLSAVGALFFPPAALVCIVVLLQVLVVFSLQP